MSFLGIDLSSVNPNPTIDDTVNGGDGGAGDFSNIANTAMQWGSVIGSIVSDTPITSAQTRSGNFQTIGPVGTTIAPNPINWTAIGLAVVAAIAVGFLIRGSK